MADNTKSKKNIHIQSIFDLNNEKNFPGTVKNLTTSETKFTLIETTDTGIINKRVLIIPKGWEKSYVCLLLINYLNGEGFRSLSRRWKHTLFKWYSDFFKYLETLDIETDINSTALIAPWYLEHLKDKYTESSIVRRIMALKSALKWNQEKNIKTGDVQYWNDIARQTLLNIPFLNRPRQNPSKTTSEKLKTDQDDNDVFLSVRTYCSWLILEMDRQRNLILDKDIKIKENILRLVSEYGIKKLSKPISATMIRQGVKKNKNIIDLHQRIKKTVLKIIRENNDVVLLEFVYMSSHHKIGELIKNLSINKSPEFNVEKMIREIEKKDFSLGYSFLDLLRPTKSEAFSLSYLLATERIQEVGQNRLEISDCVLDHKGIQFVGYQKPRSTKKSKITAHYPSNSFIYQVYDTWKKNINTYQQFSVNEKRFNHFNFLTASQCSHSLKKFSRATVFFYLPLLFNSLSRHQVQKEMPRCKLYLDIMLNEYVVIGGHKLQNKYKALDKGPAPTLRATKRVGIKALAQTRANLESKPISGLSAEANDLIDSSLSAHTPKVKKNTYKNRTTSNSVLKSGFEFSKSVSEKMLEDAGRVDELLQSTNIVTIKDLEKKLGIESSLDKLLTNESIDSLLEEAEKHGYTVGSIAELKNEGQTIIICTPLVAALILGEINHIENNIEDLANINPFKVNHYKTRKLFLQEVIVGFPNKIKKQGREMLTKYNFPYPPIS